MIMSGLEYAGDIPFHTVYLHGLIRDEHGRKMSKSYGNVIDPLSVMEELGTDALRFTLLVGSTPGNDMNLSLKKVEANRNFANKIWNAGRFVVSAIGEQQSTTDNPSFSDWTLADSWIWSKLQNLIRDVERLFQNFQYGEAGRQIYDFFWSDFADWYIEIAKLQLSQGGQRTFYTAKTLVRVLDLCLRLLHPFTPFVTEELWGYLKRTVEGSPLAEQFDDWPEALIVAPWPEPRPLEGWETDKVGDFELVQEIVRAVRNVRSEKNVQPGRRIAATLVSESAASTLSEQSAAIATLAKIDSQALAIKTQIDDKPEGSIALVVGPVEIYLPLAGLVDPAEERARLEKDLVEAKAQIERLEKLLSSPFAQKAPEVVVQKERDKLAAYRETAKKLVTQIQALEQ
jgi:valyl-tRNA synthetase